MEENKWNSKLINQQKIISSAKSISDGKVVKASDAKLLFETVIKSGDRVCLEGNNQKQADFLARTLASVDSSKINNLHMLQSVVALPEHLDVFEKGIASKLDFSFSGPQALRLAKLANAGKISIGAIHTYIELYSRYFLDLTPNICLITAEAGDRNGNLYTGPNTEETPTIVEATAFKNGIVIAQVNKLVDELPRVDIPGDWIDFVIESPYPNYVEPLFTRDPAQITEMQVLMGMMALKGIYAEYGVQRLNHGIGFNTAAIELLLPTYGEELDLKGKICSHWTVNPHPTLIPAIEAGFIKSIHSPGSEIGMEKYIEQRRDIFFTGRDGSKRSNRTFSQLAGLYGVDMFIGSTLQIDHYGNSSTATSTRIAGFGGAPNMGSNAAGRRHASDTWLRVGAEDKSRVNPLPVGKKLVVQIVETYRQQMEYAFVEKLDAIELAKNSNMALPPVMIYSEDVTHIVTEEGIANLLLCENMKEREEAIKAVAGYTPMGLSRDKKMAKALRDRGVVRYAEDLGVNKLQASRNLLAARSIKDLVRASGGLYEPPKKFRNW
ncbi:malonate decarboxylase subunit alpha [Arcobacter sp. KX21116]|uniref:malonate decarboxylase subunit alpha n=1 Tax=Arcobacter iocasae TaxID=2906515 RepID=UPI0035D46B9C